MAWTSALARSELEQSLDERMSLSHVVLNLQPKDIAMNFFSSGPAVPPKAPEPIYVDGKLTNPIDPVYDDQGNLVTPGNRQPSVVTDLIARLRARGSSPRSNDQYLMNEAAAELDKLLAIVRYVLNSDGSMQRTSDSARTYIRQQIAI